jgi:hypothetical protein
MNIFIEWNVYSVFLQCGLVYNFNAIIPQRECKDQLLFNTIIFDIYHDDVIFKGSSLKRYNIDFQKQQLIVFNI